MTSVRGYPSCQSLIDGAAAREVLVFFIDIPPACHLLAKRGLLERFRHTDPLISEQFHWAVRKGDSATRSVITDGFALVSDAERRAIEEWWMGHSVLEVLSWEKMIRWFGALPLAVVALAVWSWSLRRRVAARTAELAASEAKYEDLAAHIPVGTYRVVLSPEGEMRFEYVSPRFVELIGIEAEALLGDTSRAFAPVVPDDREELVRRNRNAAAGLCPFFWEGRFLVRGRCRWIRLESRPTPLSDGSSRGTA